MELAQEVSKEEVAFASRKASRSPVSAHMGGVQCSAEQNLLLFSPRFTDVAVIWCVCNKGD